MGKAEEHENNANVKSAVIELELKGIFIFYFLFFEKKNEEKVLN